jgi:hypothetical protein
MDYCVKKKFLTIFFYKLGILCAQLQILIELYGTSTDVKLSLTILTLLHVQADFFVGYVA